MIAIGYHEASLVVSRALSRIQLRGITPEHTPIQLATFTYLFIDCTSNT